MNHLDEIRAKLTILDVAGGYVQLKKAGRNFKGLCPFHNDSRPSFTVSPEKGIGYCFACSTGGDIFKIIQLIEKVDFPEAVRILAERAGVKLPSYKPEIHDEKRRILKANLETADFFASNLKSSETGMKYFKDRGLSITTIDEFKLGYSPDSYNGLKNHLSSRGFTEKELLTSGLLNQRSIADKNTYDRFRNRYMFPIHDHQGNTVGFGGRIIGEGEPKYLNSPDTPVYNKSYILYGLDLAKEAIKKEDQAIFVEGYMDVISAHQAGSRNVIATSGTALTSAQLKLIKRYTYNIAFAFDQDSAGMEATIRAIELAEESELNIKIILIPNGKDPDDCIRESSEAWLEAVKKAVPVMDFYFTHAFGIHDKNTLEGKKEILKLLLPIIRMYPSSMEQNEHLKRLAFELKTDVKFLWEDMKRLKTQHRKYETRNSALNTSDLLPEQKKISFSREEYLLGFILTMPDLYSIVHSNLIDSAGFDEHTERIYKALKTRYDSRSVIDPAELKEHLPEEYHDKLDILPLLIEEYYPDFAKESAEKEVISLIRSINRKNVKSAQKAFEFKIMSAKDVDERTLLLNEYNQIIKLANKI